MGDIPYSSLYPQALAAVLWCFTLLPSPSVAAGLDPPHDDSNNVGCLSCHDMAAFDQPNLIPVNGFVPDPGNIDWTLYNSVCWGCHNDIDAPRVETHSSVQTDNGYGDWTVECVVCHNQHTQEQNRVYGSTYGKYIRAKIDLAGISGVVKTGFKTIKFTGATGPGSFADGDATVDGICEVCHTETRNPATGAARFRNTGNVDTSHFRARTCSLCHDHTTGFKAECTTCHDFPPGALVSSPAPTGSTTNGAHDRHVAGKGYNCDACHFGSYGKAPSHKNAAVTMGFALFEGQYQGGAYDGQATVDYDVVVTTPATTVTRTGTKTCSNVLCHGRRTEGTVWGGGADTVPVWDGTVNCGDCHGASDAGPPTGGSHFTHTRTYASFGGGYQYPCSFCHQGPVGDDTLHGNNRSEVLFSANPMTSGGIYNGNPDLLGSYGSCTMVYCHSTVQSSPPGGAPVYRTTPVWGTTMGGCGNCHNYSDSGLATGSHAPHFYSTDNDECYTCHNYTSTDDACFACHDAPTGVPKSTHANHNIEVLFLPMLGGSYSGTGQPGDAYGDCANTYCHSSGTSLATGSVEANTSPGWGSGPVSCSSCHGNGPSYANGSPKANSHQVAAHTSYTCNFCHSSTTSDGTSITNGENHVNMVYDVIAGGGESFTYTFAAGGGTCASVSCHAGGASRIWGSQ